MKNTLLLLFVLTTCSTFAQFSSVKDGDWRDPLTWSTNPNATAIPDSNSTVLVSHYVVASSSAYVQAECKDLTIAPGGVIDNYSSAITTGSLNVKNDLVNNGTISPAYDFYLSVGGTFFNNGTTTKHYISSFQKLYLMGDIVNNGSFHFTHTYFGKTDLAPNVIPHLHNIKSRNDSIIFLGETMFLDSLGTMIIDSFAILNGTINLNASKMLLPAEITHPNNLGLDNATLYGGVIDANKNTISTNGTLAYVGYLYSQSPNLVFVNANLVGRFVSGGNATDASGNSMVIFKGETTFEGNFADWYNGNVWYNGDRGIFIEGTFTNNGNIYDATTDKGLFLNQKDNSTFISNGTVNNKAIIFSGTCNFSVLDSISAAQFETTDSNTVVNITHGDLIFKDRTVTVDFNDGTLNLANGSKIITTYQWYNRLQNININANGGEIKFASINNNVSISNPSLNGVYYIVNSSLKGEIVVPASGYIFPYTDYYPHVLIDGNIANSGRIENHTTSGSLYIECTGNITYDGISWKNIETKLTGTGDQYILLPNNKPITGKVVLDAMLNGTNYQWQKGGSDISQATQSTLAFNSGVSMQEYGLYQCIVDGIPSRKIFFGQSAPPAFEIYDVKISNLSATQTQVEWKTTVPASGFIFYAENDTTNGYPLEAMEPQGAFLQHSLMLENLTKGSTYYFIIDQNDSVWNNIRSVPYSFVAGDSLVGVKDLENVPTEFSLSQNYPNPFNPVTSIQYSIVASEHVSLKIYDVLGKEVAELVNEQEAPGYYEVGWNATAFSSGVYFYRLQAGEFNSVKKFLLMK